MLVSLFQIKNKIKHVYVDLISIERSIKHTEKRKLKKKYYEVNGIK